MATRQAVFAAVNSEREYQEVKWNDSVEPTHTHSVPEWLVFIEDYVNEAKRVYTRREEPFATTFGLHTLRKIAAMAVAALEQNGVVTRVEEGIRPVGYIES